MSNSDKNTLSFQRIAGSDTISQFMEKVNNNFEKIIESNGGPAGVKGDDGDQGIPTKPKVPIHVWVEGENYAIENKLNEREYEVVHNEDLTNVKYQEGHLIMLQNAHVYKLENIDGNLTPKFMITLQSYDPASIINGKNAYVHIAYADSSNGQIGFVTAQEVRGEFIEEQATTFGLNRNLNTTDISNKAYMGMCSNENQKSPSHYSAYTWVRIQGNAGSAGLQGETGPQGPQGPKGDKGDKGDGYTGHPFTIDLEGDMSTISVDIYGCRRYEDDYCECILHGYYGNENVNLSEVCTKIEIKLPEEYDYYDVNKKTDIVHVSDRKTIIGQIEKKSNGNNIIIHFKPYANFVFPKKTILFPIHIEASVFDKDDGKTYDFARDLVWMVKGIVSTFELEILPQYRAIKLFDDGQYYPEKLLVTVYKVEDAKRDVFDFSQIENSDFTLLYKNLDDTIWKEYPDEGVDTKGVSCLEFKVVRYYGSTDPKKPEEIWDYEDVWVVADGKSVHYYHADLGNAESMMVLTTGEMINEGTEDEPIYCAKLRNESGYSITFEPKFYDGTTELEVTDVNIGSINGEEYTKVGSFDYTLGDLTEVEEVNGIKRYQITFTITKVPYNVDMIPMTFDVRAKCPIYDNSGNITGEEAKNDSVSFNVYISTLSSLYTLIPTVSTYNTSTGKDGDTIGCSVYKNDVLIETTDLNQNALSLKYIVFDGGTEPKEPITYTEPLKYGKDDDIIKDEFTAEDVAIVFILSYRGNEVARSTVPLIKDGIDGRDGDSWQYIFCRSPYYPFGNTGISNPSNWEKDPNSKNSNSEYLGDNEENYSNDPKLQWYDDHKGVDSINRYEYQSYRKWDKDKKCWGSYGDPTLYSNYSESGSGYSVLLSNPVAVIPVGDNNWVVGDDDIDEIQSDSTLVYLYNNTSDISSNQNVTISLPDKDEITRHFSTDKDENGINRVTFNPVKDGKYFDFGSNTQYKLPITLTYILGEDSDGDNIEEHFTSTINWTLSPIKGLVDFEVFVDKRIVNISSSSTHYLNVGYYVTSSNGGKKFIEEYNDTYGYQIILTDNIGNTGNIEDIEDIEIVTLNNWQNVTYNFKNESGEKRNCYVVLVGKDGKTIIDYAEVISVTDGNDGKSAIHLELTQDYIALPSNPDGITTDNGAVHPAYNTAVQATMNLYDGITLISNEENLITYSFKINGKSPNEINENVNISVYSNGGFEIPKSLILGDTNLECIATYKGASYSKTIFIDLEKIPYELELNKSILTRDPNTNIITDTTLEIRVKYWMDGQWVYTPSGTVVISTPNIPATIRISKPTYDNDDKYTRIISIQNQTLFQQAEKEIRISYIGTSNKELSYEIIGIISNGKDGQKGEDGTAPTCIKTEILGYSLDENATIPDGESDVSNKVGDGVNPSTGKNYMWQTHINKLNAEPGVTIYMLNRYTWETTIGNTKQTYTTFGITVTLAGTQGIEGKSRVLFYLGSYYEGTPDKPKTPTLKDSVKTTLNDVQCDYYIDSNGEAWMRTGKETDATLYPDSLDYHVYTIKDGPDISKNPYWVKSTPVGFLQAGAITADMIDATNLSVCKLNTKPDENKHSVVVQDNKVLIKDDGGYDICKFCDDEIDANLNDAFKEKKPVNITYHLSTSQNYVNRIDPNDYIYKTTYIITNINLPVDIYKTDTTENTTKYNFGDSINRMIASNKIVTFGSTITSNINVTEFYNKSVDNKNCKVKVTVKPIITVYRSGSDTAVYTYTHNGKEKSLDYNNQTAKINSNIKFKFITPVEDKYSFTLNFNLNYVAENAYVGGVNIFTHSIPSLSASNIKINFGGYANNTRSEIYKNGMLIQNEINGILVCEGGILLKFNNYGIKLDANGISYATNLLDYQNDLSNANWTTNWSNLNK